MLIKELNKKLFTLKDTNIKKYLVVGGENLYYKVTIRGYRWIYQEKKKKRKKKKDKIRYYLSENKNLILIRNLRLLLKK